MIAAARDAGVNFIDTADVYNGGKSEEVVGRAIRNERDRWVVATKLNGIMGEGPNQRGSSRKWIFEAARTAASPGSAPTTSTSTTCTARTSRRRSRNWCTLWPIWCAPG